MSDRAGSTSDGAADPTLRTVDLARITGYSVQQVRDLERLGVIPAAPRAPNGYRVYSRRHVRALRAYRGLAVAAGPVTARRTLRGLTEGPATAAAAAVSALHAGLHRERADLLAAGAALRAIAAEADGPTGLTRTDVAPGSDAGAGVGGPADAMSITELGGALGVRTSTLRHWEHEGLLHPDRVTSLRVRRYDVATTRTARIVAALRAAGYGIDAVRGLLVRLGREPGETNRILEARLADVGTRSLALLRAGADLADVIEAGEARVD
ncbi:MerR family transcriptional regulator [Occultella glacieicola]|uniref:MerR family transcriptional regulator n=1 Tax=Occultella glacieicola TaxID=2518684 RepID=A0ABY2E2A2_9MICO|nr:MerR family transcriptional regulator [Occultella glacieicola]TDE92691.1 MerR family transcriptional regulator [Occultella glacieicola]